MNSREIQQALADVGWPIAIDGIIGPESRRAISDFQMGWTYTTLAVDGIAGPQTQDALHSCLRYGGRAGRFFWFREFRSKGDGWIRVHRKLVWGLDAARNEIGRPLHIQSGYRDPAHNHAVGGVKDSQHVYGTAADIEPNLPDENFVRSIGIFSGIGIRRSDGTIAHVDVRADGPNNTTGSSVDRPARWYYG